MAFQSLLLALEVLEELAGPVSNHPDVERDDVGLLGGRANGERVPLEGGDGRDVDEDVVAGLEGEVRRTLDYQADDSRGQNHAWNEERKARP